MILAYHIILSAYGFWLPNDPRGSWSDFVASWELLRYGKATKVDTARSVAGARHDHRLRKEAKSALKYPAVSFSGRQARAIARGFDRARQEGGYEVLACAILPEHTHMVIARHPRNIGCMVGHFKGRATQRLAEERLWPADARPVWAEGNWKVFLDSEADVARAIHYVEGNPEKEGKPRQRWWFVVPRQ